MKYSAGNAADHCTGDSTEHTTRCADRRRWRFLRLMHGGGNGNACRGVSGRRRWCSELRVAARVAEANLIHDVTPQYPPEAGRARIEGTVVLMAVIGQDGTVKDVRIESGLPILTQAAIDAVKQWRYKPYMIDGEAVEVDSRITINFTLSAS